MGPETDLAENELRRQLATLALSHVHPAGAMEAIAAASWWNMLARLGLRVPLVVVHDFGLLLSRNREGSRREVARSSTTPALARYRGLLAGLASSEVIQDLGTAPLRDETVAVILARLLSDVYLRWTGRPRTSVDIHELPMSSPAYDGDRAAQARELDPAWSHPFIQRLCEHERAVLARLDQIDAGRAAAARAVLVPGRRVRSGRPLPGGQHVGRGRHRRLLAAAPAVAARDQAAAGGAALLHRRLRVGRAAREPRRRCCPASWRTTTRSSRRRRCPTTCSTTATSASTRPGASCTTC